LDGEIVVPGENGAPSFQALQNAFDASKTAGIVYYLFDAPFLAGRDLRREPLDVRRKLLKQLLSRSDDKDDEKPGNLLRFSDDFDVQPKDLIVSACRMGLEGVIGKRRASPYVMRRADSWIKLKCTQRQEFVIAGYTSPKGGRAGFGSLLLGVHSDDGELRYAGNVGTGFDQATLVDIKKRLDGLLTPQRPFTKATALDRTAHWVKPLLLAEVSFSEWTSAGSVRHAVFHGLREDKPAKAITRERARSAQTLPTDGPMRASPKTVAVDKTLARPAKKAATSKAQPNMQPTSRSPAPTKASSKAKAMETEPGDQLRVTHGDRVIDPSTGATKLQLVRFYLLVAPLMVAHLRQRPVSLVRAPGGITGQLFFQKHLEASIPSPKAIVSATQMNVIEFHTWNAVKTAIGKPDRMTFDLDPGEGVSWHRIQQAAQLVRAFLLQLGLSAFLKTSGGKGLHVVVPVKKHFDWDTVKGFSQAIVQHLAKTLPDHFVAKSGPKNRVGKIFVDYLRNGFGATTVSAWSARARPGLGVSVPVDWDEIEALSGGAHWHIANIHERLDAGNAPWTDYAAQSIVPAMKALGYTPTDRG
jgi:bifunctional non-homologous end joining protein LigD